MTGLGGVTQVAPWEKSLKNTRKKSHVKTETGTKQTNKHANQNFTTRGTSQLRHCSHWQQDLFHIAARLHLREDSHLPPLQV